MAGYQVQLLVSEGLWYTLGASLLAAGALVLLLLAVRSTRSIEGARLLYFAAALVSAALYLAMALGQLAVQVPEAGGRVFLARYLDWLLTTPLLLLGLSLVALGAVRRRPALVAGLLFSDVFMVATGLAAALSTRLHAKALWFVSSLFAFAAILALIWGPLRREAGGNSPQVARVYRALALGVTCTWLWYPVVWLLAPTGWGLFDASLTACVFLGLDLATRVAYGLYASLAERRLSPSVQHYRPVVSPIPEGGMPQPPSPRRKPPTRRPAPAGL